MIDPAEFAAEKASVVRAFQDAQIVARKTRALTADQKRLVRELVEDEGYTRVQAILLVIEGAA